MILGSLVLDKEKQNKNFVSIHVDTKCYSAKD